MLTILKGVKLYVFKLAYTTQFRNLEKYTGEICSGGSK